MADQRGEATTLNELGAVYQSAGRSDEAEACFQESMSLWQTLGDQAEQATTLTALGRLYQSEGRPDEAEGVIRKVFPCREAWETSAG